MSILSFQHKIKTASDELYFNPAFPLLKPKLQNAGLNDTLQTDEQDYRALSFVSSITVLS